MTKHLGLQKGVDMTKLDVSVGELTVAALTAVALILCITFFNGAGAESISNSKRLALTKSISTEYNAAQIRCESLTDNAQALCDAKAERAKALAEAKLEASFTPTTITRYDANLEKSDAIKKDKTSKFDESGYQRNPFMTVEFNNIYHVKA